MKSLTSVGLFVFGLFVFSESFAQISSVENLQIRAQQEKWHEDPQWRKLVQYQKKLFRGNESPAEDTKFFLSPQGKNRPDLELQATLKALFENQLKIKSRDAKFEDPVACVFPARKLWLEQKTGTKFPTAACERFERFKEILAPQSLTYVFSSYYLNNPASAFGHTFLRVNKAPSAKDGERYELADYGVGYAAMKVSENPFVYSFMGVSGLMPGTFDINPYYYKVREYNDFESRDLWEYDLNFSPAEVEMAVAYIWELLDVGFNYHYFSENCSYRILSILEVARPDLELTSRLKAQVMPADTVQTIFQQQGLVEKIHYRPSVRATFEARYKSLSPEAQKKLRRFASNESLPDLVKDLQGNDKQEALDAAMDYLDYAYPKEILRKEGKYFFKKEVLLARAEAGGASKPLQIETPWSEAPHEAQGSRRWGFGYREWDQQKYYLFDVKLALHDLLDMKWGYPSTAEITMGSFAFTWNVDSREAALDKALLYEVVSLAPIDDFKKGSSWRLKFSVERGFENACDSLCRWTELSGGTGATKTLWQDLDLSFWLRSTATTSNDYVNDKWALGGGPGASIRWNRGSFALMAETYYRYDYKGRNQEFRIHTAGLNWSLSKNLGLRLGGEKNNRAEKLEGRVLYYY